MFLGRNVAGARRRTENSSRTKRREPLCRLAENLLAPAPGRGELFPCVPPRRSTPHHPRRRQTPETPTVADPAHKIQGFGHNLTNWPPRPEPLPKPFSLAPDLDRSPRCRAISSRRFGLRL